MADRVEPTRPPAQNAGLLLNPAFAVALLSRPGGKHRDALPIDRNRRSTVGKRPKRHVYTSIDARLPLKTPVAVRRNRSSDPLEAVCVWSDRGSHKISARHDVYPSPNRRPRAGGGDNPGLGAGGRAESHSILRSI